MKLKLDENVTYAAVAVLAGAATTYTPSPTKV